MWALGARAVGRIDPNLTAVDLAARYVGLSVAVFVGMGALAPILRRGWAATLYAGIFGVGFVMLAVSLVGDVGVGWIVYGSVVAAPMFAWSFSDEIRKGAVSLCDMSGRPPANQSP
jgi:hypothetical protein